MSHEQNEEDYTVLTITAARLEGLTINAERVGFGRVFLEGLAVECGSADVGRFDVDPDVQS